MNLKEMSNKALINRLLSDSYIQYPKDSYRRSFNELMTRLEDGAMAIKAMEELNNLFPKCAPSPDRIPLCFVILDKYRSGKGGKKC